MTNYEILSNLPVEIASGNIPETLLLCRNNNVIKLPENYKFRDSDRIVSYSNTNGFASLNDIPLTNYLPEFTTAEQWLEQNGIGAARQPTLLYLRQSLLAANKTSNSLDTLEQYLHTILSLYAQDQTPRNNWPELPITFEAVVQEATQLLS